MLTCLAAPAWANQTDDGVSALDLPAEEEPAAITSHSPRPISHIAENVTVITADQIAALNAHTLADVLQTVTGVFVEQTRTPGNWTAFYLQGETDTSGNILLLIDGVSQGNLLQGAIDPGLFPVQNIERIEIIKGSASATTGGTNRTITASMPWS